MLNRDEKKHPGLFLSFDLIAGGAILGLSASNLGTIDSRYADVSCAPYSSCSKRRIRINEIVAGIIGIITAWVPFFFYSFLLLLYYSVLCIIGDLCWMWADENRLVYLGLVGWWAYVCSKLKQPKRTPRYLNSDC